MSDAPPARRHGPAVGEPPLLADPRRWGSMIGLAGGLVFIGSYSPVLGSVVSAVAWLLGGALALAALAAHYLRPVALGPLARARPLALATYGACVVAELALLDVGTRALDGAGHTDLRPALIAAVVGLHFLPMAWAFSERMFLLLGGVVAVLGVVGLTAGLAGIARAADALAVLAGLAMLVVGLAYARGRFAPA